MAETDRAVLSVLEDEVLGGRLIDELLLLVDAAPPDETERLRHEEQQVRAEISTLLESVAAGIPPGTVAPKVREREEKLARITADLQRPRPVPVNRDRLRAALQRQGQQWAEVLRSEPTVARALLRRLIGPISVWEESDPKEIIPLESARAEARCVREARWSAEVRSDAIAEGLPDGLSCALVPSRARKVHKINGRIPLRAGTRASASA